MTAEPGAEVWVDQARVGPSPAKIVVGAGAHGRGRGRGHAPRARQVTVEAPDQLAVPLADQEGAWGAVAETVRGWRGVAAAGPTGSPR